MQEKVTLEDLSFLQEKKVPVTSLLGFGSVFLWGFLKLLLI